MLKKKVTVLATTAILSTAFSAQAQASTYVVKKGDTLTKIANQHKTTVKELKTLNNLSSDLILINQKLTVSQNTESSQSTEVSTPSTNQTTAKTYTVVSGDSLIKIANKHSISLAELKQWNQLTSTLIYPGDVLNVTKPASTESKGEPPSNNVQAPTVPSDTYTIKSGDTLGKIAATYSLSVAKLKSLNNLTSDLIFPGQKLKVKESTNTTPSTTENTSNSSESSNPTFISDGNSNQSLTNKLLSVSTSLIGIPYKWAGTATDGFDCSGFIYYVFNQSGEKMNRLSAAGYYDRSYDVAIPVIGDLVFFKDTYKQGISHLGIYIGNNQFIHADSSGVRITSLDNAYYKNHFDSFKRFY